MKMIAKLMLAAAIAAAGASTTLGQTPGPRFPIRIDVATYGHGKQRATVTEKVRTACEGRTTCSIPITNEFFGVDPVPNWKKDGWVKWTCGGRGPYDEHRIEGGSLVIECSQS